MRSPWNGGSISLRRGEVLAALEQQQRARAHDRLQRERPAGRERVAGHGVERADRLRVGEHHHRRLEAEERDAERVAEAPPAGLQERDRPQQPAQGLHDGRLGRPWRQRAHAAYCRIVCLDDVAAASETVGATSARGGKIAALADALRLASPEEAAIAVAFLSGELRQRQIGVGWAALQDLPAPAARAVARARRGRRGVRAHRRAERRRLAGGAPGRAGRAVRARHRARAALPARAARRRAAPGRARGRDGRGRRQGRGGAGRRAAPRGDAARRPRRRSPRPRWPAACRRCARSGCRSAAPHPRRCSPPPPPTSTAAMEKLSPAAVEWKLDGIRVAGPPRRRATSPSSAARSTTSPSGCRGSSRPRCALPVRSVVLDGEAIALRDDGRPHAFQDTGLEPRRTRAADGAVLRRAPPRRRGRARRAGRRARRARSPRSCPRRCASRARVAADAEAAAPCSTTRSRMGHEGVIVKSLDAPYAAGRRGAGWLKVKPVHTLDLVVLAAEWGHGRRRGWLSNLHLGARHDTEPGRFVMLGKTFKGLTDEMLRGRPSSCSSSRPTAATGSSTSAPSSSSRSRSTASSAARATRAASPCASRACSATGPTSAPRRPTRSRRCWRWARPRAHERLIPGGLEDRREQAREAGLEVVLAQRVDALGALLALPDDTGLAQDLEVVGAGRLRDRHVEAAAAAALELAGQPADHQEADGVAEGVEDGRELDLVAAGVGDAFRGSAFRLLFGVLVRRSSYIC